MTATIERVAWPVAGVPSGRTRPEALVAALTALGAIAPGSERVGHRRGPRWTALWPALHGRRADALLSPLFAAPASGDARWIDLYDDWSLAPDINRWHRVVAAAGYRAVSRRADRSMVTVNSPYLADRLRLPREAVIPNGVDPALATLPRGGDDARRLVLLGHFFEGRTDFALIQELLGSEHIDEVVIGGTETGDNAPAWLTAALRGARPEVRVHGWLDAERLAAITGPRTALVVPHVVTDYTLSQDLMKVYMALALGMRVVCPRLLWPPSVDIEHAFLLDFGVRLADLGGWLDEPGVTDEYRRQHAHRHSWEQRARATGAYLGWWDA